VESLFRALGTRVVLHTAYHSTWPLTGGHANRPPLFQPDPDLQGPDVVGEYQRALAAGDVEAVVAAFEPDAYMREPAGGAHVHRGRDALRALYELFFSNGGGIPLAHCAAFDDGRTCAWSTTWLPGAPDDSVPRGGRRRLCPRRQWQARAARVYDDADPPLSASA
jgi:hypothetical protein